MSTVQHVMRHQWPENTCTASPRIGIVLLYLVLPPEEKVKKKKEENNPLKK